MLTVQTKKVTAKKLEVYLKRNLTGQEIAEKLGFGSLEELDETIKKDLSSNGYEYYHGRLFKKVSRKRKNSSKGTTEIDVHSEEMVAESTILPDNKPTIEELKLLEKQLQDSTVSCEVEVKNILQEARENLKEINELKNRIDGWKKLIKDAIAQVDSLESKSFEIVDKHEIASSKLHEEQQKLQSVRDQIDERSIVFILVDNNSEIEAEMDGKPIKLEFGDWRSFYNGIISKSPDCIGDLRINQLVQIAKILSLPQDVTYDITFENDSVKSLFDSLKGGFIN